MHGSVRSFVRSGRSPVIATKQTRANSVLAGCRWLIASHASRLVARSCQLRSARCASVCVAGANDTDVTRRATRGAARRAWPVGAPTSSPIRSVVCGRGTHTPAHTHRRNRNRANIATQKDRIRAADSIRFGFGVCRRRSKHQSAPAKSRIVCRAATRCGAHPHRRCAMSLVASARVAGAGAAVLTHDRRAQSSGVADDGCGSPSPISPRMSGARGGRRADRALAVRLPADARMRAAWSGQCLTLVRARAAVARVMRCVCAR